MTKQTYGVGVYEAGHRASIDFSRPDVSNVMKEEITPAGFYVAVGAIAGVGIGSSSTLAVLSVLGVLR